jgi:type II secretory pathway component PulK
MLSDQRGATFIIVIWVIVIITFLLGSAVEEVDLDLNLSKNFSHWTSSYYLARAGVEEAITFLLDDDNEYDSLDEPWSLLSERPWIELSTGEYQVKIEDEGSKLNLNTITESLLKSLPVLSREDVDSFLDWRDLEDGCKHRNGLFEAVEEIKYIQGFEKIYDEVKGLFTVYGKFNPNIVDFEAFDALLIALGVDKFQSQMITNDLIARRHSGERFRTEEEFKDATTSFTEEIWEKLMPFITMEGSINLNTVSAALLEVIFSHIGLSQEVERVIEIRETAPFTNLSEIVNEPEKLHALKDYFTVRSEYFYISARGKAKDSKVISGIEVIVRRYKESSDDKWNVKILSWTVR